MNKKKQVKKQLGSSLMKILDSGTKSDIRALFSFDITDTEKEVLLKFNLWGRHFFPKFYKFKDADFHKDIDKYNYRVYRGEDLKYFIDIVFRSGAKTTRTKLFIAYCIANDSDHSRKFFKILTKDISNAKQVVTDIYNLLLSISSYYPEIFQKTDQKKEERMDSFTTYTGVKMRAGTVGTDQRGQIQEDTRPDFIVFDDFETRKTLRSAVETKSIWDNMEEAKTGLSRNGGAVYLCNYFSERGNVHKLVLKKNNPKTKVLIVPIKFEGKPMWDYYNMDIINALEKDSDDFAGEYMCLKPTTLILTKEGWEEISSLKVGDKVITHLNRERKILQVFERNDNELLDITVNGEIVTITKNHPVLTIRENIKDWIPAGELTTDDLIYVIPLGKLIV